MSQTVADIIDDARLRHFSFADVALGDGAALRFLNGRQRIHLASYGSDIDGIVGTSMQYALALNTSGLLVGLVNGVPVYLTTYQDGWPVHLDVNGVPYSDFSEAPLATDPFGQHGGTPGFPLPADMVRLVNVAGVYSTNGRVIPIDVIPEGERHNWLPGRNPTAFVSGNRLVPLFPMDGSANNASSRWFQITTIQISYVAIQTLTALADVLMLPTLLCEALVADLAAMFAGQSQKCPPADKRIHLDEAMKCAARVASAANDMLSSVEQTTILYKP